MYTSQLDLIASNIPRVDHKRQYWFVRTNGGDYYNEFGELGIIGLAWNNITKDMVYKSFEKFSEKDAKENLKKIASKLYPDYAQPGYIIAQLEKLFFEIKQNDVIIIPDEKSIILRIGIVEDNRVYSKEDLPFNHSLNLNKYRKVRWLKTILKYRLEADLYKMLNSHHPIANADIYSNYIDRLIYPIYLKEDSFHLTINVGASHTLKARDLFGTWINIFDLIEDYARENNIKVNVDNVESKIRVQSAGVVELISFDPYTLILIATILIFLVGGGYEFDLKGIKASFKTDGLFKSLTDYLNNRTNRKKQEVLIKKAKERLKIDSNKELENIILGKKIDEALEQKDKSSSKKKKNGKKKSK